MLLQLVTAEHLSVDARQFLRATADVHLAVTADVPQAAMADATLADATADVDLASVTVASVTVVSEAAWAT